MPCLMSIVSALENVVCLRLLFNKNGLKYSERKQLLDKSKQIGQVYQAIHTRQPRSSNFLNHRERFEIEEHNHIIASVQECQAWLDEYKVTVDGCLEHGQFTSYYIGRSAQQDRLFIKFESLNYKRRNIKHLIHKAQVELEECLHNKLTHEHISKLELGFYIYRNSFTYRISCFKYESYSIAELNYEGHFFGERDIISLIRQIGTALDYLHSNSIAHNDICPSNILMNKKYEGKNMDYEFKLTNLREARVYSTGKRRETLQVGTHKRYFAPEKVDIRTNYDPFLADCYSLGMVAVESVENFIYPLCHFEQTYLALKLSGFFIIHLRLSSSMITLLYDMMTKEVDRININRAIRYLEVVEENLSTKTN